MEPTVVTIQLPTDVHSRLQALAAEEHTSPVEMIERLVEMKSRRRGWLRDLAALREQILQDGGLKIGVTKEEVVERLRQTRSEIFEAEYAHLY